MLGPEDGRGVWRFRPSLRAAAIVSRATLRGRLGRGVFLRLKGFVDPHEGTPKEIARLDLESFPARPLLFQLVRKSDCREEHRLRGNRPPSGSHGRDLCIDGRRETGELTFRGRAYDLVALPPDVELYRSAIHGFED